jgi:hypothetical protein
MFREEDEERLVKSLTLAFVAFFAFAASAASDPYDGVVVAKGKASGNHAHAKAIVVRSKLRVHYDAVTVKVTSSPPQRVAASWAMTCYQGMSFGRKFSDQSGRTPLSIPVYPGKYLYSPTVAEECSIVAEAALRGRGRVTVAVLAR